MKTYIAIILCLSLAATGAFVLGKEDDISLKKQLMGYFYADEGVTLEDINAVKMQYDVSGEQLHQVLMDIYHEANNNLEAHEPGTRDWLDNRKTVASVIWCLPECDGVPIKKFLFDYASLPANIDIIRIGAIYAYLRVADAQETKEALTRFLGNGGAGIDPLSIYTHASEIYDKTDSNDAAGAAKRRAIIAALMVAAANERGKIGFVEVDRILAMRSEAYRNSRERFALLERHSLEPPTKNLYTDADLQRTLAEMRRLKRYTSVNTNAALLAAHDFTSSRTADNDDMWGGKLVVPSPEVMFAPRGLPPDSSPTFLRQNWFWLACACGFMGLLGVGVFVRWRRRQ